MTGIWTKRSGCDANVDRFARLQQRCCSFENGCGRCCKTLSKDSNDSSLAPGSAGRLSAKRAPPKLKRYVALEEKKVRWIIKPGYVANHLLWYVSRCEEEVKTDLKNYHFAGVVQRVAEFISELSSIHVESMKGSESGFLFWLFFSLTRVEKILCTAMQRRIRCAKRTNMRCFSRCDFCCIPCLPWFLTQLRTSNSAPHRSWNWRTSSLSGPIVLLSKLFFLLNVLQAGPSWMLSETRPTVCLKVV